MRGRSSSSFFSILLFSIIIVTTIGSPAAQVSGTRTDPQKRTYSPYKSSRTPRCDLSATIELHSLTQRRSYDGYVYQTIDRMIHTQKKLWSHVIQTRVKIKNVHEEPITFVFKWYGPDGELIDKSAHVRPDPDPGVILRGHWTLYPIQYDVEFKERPEGKYTVIVEHPEGTLLAEKSFNFYMLESDKNNIFKRHSKTIVLAILGIALFSLTLVTLRVLH